MATIVAKNPANDPDKKPVKSHSKFQPNRSLYQTMVFGLNTPILGMEAVEGDRVSIRIKSDVDTLNMTAPLMTPVKMSKDYFFAPLRAILPHNADKFITNPLTGEDIVPENVAPIMDISNLNSYRTYLATTLNSLIGNAAGSADSTRSSLELLRALCIAVKYGDPFFSAGSLLNTLGCNLMPFLYWYEWGGAKGHRTWDSFVELLCDTILQHVQTFQVDYAYYSSMSVTPVPTPSSNTIIVDCTLGSDEGFDGNANTISFRRFLNMLRQGLMVRNVNTVVMKSTDAGTAYTVLYPVAGTRLYLQYGTPFVKPFNISRLVAYQLACASFYTDDAIDYVYSCDLWHQNLWSCARYAIGPNQITHYRYMLNGISMEYDSVSGHVLGQILFNATQNFDTSALGGTATSGNLYQVSYEKSALWAAAYINNLFGFTRSLKFRDYFCGSKTRPMAVGNVDVTVSGGQFSVVDVTKNIQMQRFLNQVNRVGRKFNEYVQGIFGVTPAHDPHEVIFLGHTSEYIGSEETNETAGALLTDAQTTRTKMRRSSSQFAFEGQFNEPGVLIGIVNFDVARPYTTVTERPFFHYDRFAMFNPYMQHVGDQEVFGPEISPAQINNVGYQLRYSEYKQAVDRAVAGFVEFLPGFAFLNDPVTLRPAYGSDIVISPDFIRARPTELDKFFNVMSHYSQAGYFHFIARHDISIDAVRPMEAAPSIL